MILYRLTFFYLLLCLAFPLTLHADPLEDANAAMKNEDYKKAYELLLPLAEEKNPEAQTRLGALYVNGQGVEKDFNKGLALIMKAAKKGYKPARIVAYKLFMDLGNQGDATAMYNVGYMCLNGWIGEQNTDVCLRWLESSAKMGHERSASMLSRIYTKGMFGVTPDEKKATYWNNLQADFAAGVDGKWEGSVPMGPGAQPMKLSYEFKTDGDSLTGTTVGYGGEKIAIKDGKIDGNNLSFTVESKVGNMTSNVNYTGLFLGDTITLSFISNMAGPGGKKPEPISFTVKRAK